MSHHGGFGGGHTGKLPKFDFPKFDGDYPKLWIKQAIHYFDLHDIESVVWVQAATMHFQGAAKHWLSSFENQLESVGWDEFCSQILTRFACDEHELLRRLFKIHQISTVDEYIDHFITLVDQLKAYVKHPDSLYYTQRFIDGLREAVVLVHHPGVLSPYLVCKLSPKVATFLSSKVAQSLSGVQTLEPAVQVHVANGAILQCTCHIPSASWSVQDYSFTTDLKLLPLSSYDIILGLDWLVSFRPTQVHWEQRWISISYAGSSAILLGDAPDLPVGSVIQLCLVQDSDASSSSIVISPSVQALVNEFATLFEPILGLPLSQHCDLAIPLIPGAQPVYVRQCRYALLLKSEIERQVADMLQQVIIQKSSSPFASPVLLVKKRTKAGDSAWTIDNSMPSLSRANTLYLSLKNFLMSYLVLHTSQH